MNAARRTTSLILTPLVASVVTWLSLGAAAPASAQLIKDSIPQTEGVGVVDRRGGHVPLDLVFTDSDGKRVTAKQLFDGKRPVLLVMAYYTCPLLCALVLDHVQDSLNQLEWVAGEEFRVVTISFDHRNTPEQAAVKKATYLLGYEPGDGAKDVKRELKPDAWQFLCADVKNAQAISSAVGFHYRYLPENGEFSHPSAIFFLTPEGRVSGFIENLKFEPKDVKLALTQAGEGKTGSLFDRIIMTCFMYDPTKGTYVLAAKQVMKIGGVLTALTLGVFVAGMFVYSHRRRADLTGPESAPNGPESGSVGAPKFDGGVTRAV
ncbi:MAG: SCO family protein [Phycisphaerales bacterium]